MRETFTNDQESTSSGNGRPNRPVRTIPKRRGSKFADILLQRLLSTALSETDSNLIGMLSHAPRQGVTTTAVNLAIRAADHFYTPSLIIDGNITNHKITRLYRCTGEGLGECLNGQASLDRCIKRTNIPGFNALGVGKHKISKQVLFDSDIAGEFFKMVRNDFRFTVADLPAVDEPSLVDSIVPHLDGVVLVARYGSRRDQLAKMQDKVLNSGGKVIGVVMTGNEDKLPGWAPGFLN